MNWFKALVFGILIFALFFVIGSILMFGLGLKMNELPAQVSMLVIAVIVLWLLSAWYRLKGATDGFLVGLTWMVVNIVLEDLVLVLLFNQGNAAAYYSWSIIIGYMLELVIPLYVGGTAKK